MLSKVAALRDLLRSLLGQFLVYRPSGRIPTQSERAILNELRSHSEIDDSPQLLRAIMISGEEASSGGRVLERGRVRCAGAG